MAFFTVTRPAASMTVGNDMLTLTAAAGKPLNVWSIDVNGVQNASLAGELKLSRSTGGATGTTVTPAKVDTNSPAASFTATHSWTSQPSITANSDLWIFSVNANGGKDRFPGYPQPIPVPGSGQVSLRVLVGTHQVDQTWLVEELG
jgi:hypothetical protein